MRLSKMNPPALEIENFQSAILQWYRVNKRDLPWRKTNDAYKIWICEIMCQQTGVSTVIPYYERFLKKFPSIKALAQSKEQDVLKLWEGLGYYSRARNLRSAAQIIKNEFDGEFPKSEDLIKKLPGIGEYTSGAILSIAFRKPAAALDGNLIRIYARYFGFQKEVNIPRHLKELWSLAREMVPKEKRHTREFAEGMMDLGAMVCRPKNPACLLCPLRKKCQARRCGLQHELPKKVKSREREKYFEKVYLYQRAEKWAVMKKAFDPKYPDFYRLPYERISKEKLPTEYYRIEKYAVTYRDFKVYVVKKKPPKALEAQVLWKTEKQLQNLVFPAIDRRLISLCLKPKKTPRAA